MMLLTSILVVFTLINKLIAAHSVQNSSYRNLYEFVCNPLDYGAVGDGIHDDTYAIQTAMDKCYGNNGSSGLVYLSSNKVFLSYALTVINKFNCTLMIEQNATFLVGNNISMWNLTDRTSFMTLEYVNTFNLIGGGLIDGQGEIWWQEWNKNNSIGRPYIMFARDTSRNFFISNITVINQPYHTFEMYSDYNEFSYVTVYAPGNSSQTDAVDARGNYYYIHDCWFSEGDDNVAVMGNHTLVQDCYFGTGHGASIGSLKTEYHAVYVKNVTFENIIFNGTQHGCRIKAWPGQPYGNVTDVIFRNLSMTNVGNTIILNQYYNEPNNVSNISNLYFDNIHFADITSTLAGNPGIFNCQPSSPCYNIDLQNVYIKCTNQTNCQYQCEYVHGSAKNVTPNVCFD